MARPDREAIDTFMSITSVSEAEAIRKLEEHQGSLNEAVNAHFSDGDRNIAQGASFTAPQDDNMDIDDPIQVETHRPPTSRLPFAGDLNPFSLLDPNFTRSIFDTGTNLTPHSPFVSHAREVREIPVEVKDDTGASGHTSSAPIIEDMTENAHDHGPEIHGTVLLDEEEANGDVVFPNAPFIQGDIHGNQVRSVPSRSSAPTIVDVPYNDIEEEMVRAAIEASKQDTEMSSQQYDHLDHGVPTSQPTQSHLEDVELAHAVSLSLQTAETEKALRELDGKIDSSELEAQKSAMPEETGKVMPSNGRLSHLENGSSSTQGEAEDVDDVQLIRHRRRRMNSTSVDLPNDNRGVEINPTSSPQQNDDVRSQNSGSDFPSVEWGGISSVEHDEAVMLEAAMFGGIPEGSGYHLPYGSHQFMQSVLDDGADPYARHIPRPPSPSLTAQRLIREQQDDEYLASLQADREKELKAKEEAEAALAEERRKEEELHRQQQEEQEIERQLEAKEASLPQEPAPDDDNAVTLLVRMPDGSRRSRRFLKSDKLQHLFNFIDVGRGVKPGGYRLVRPYPRRAFGDEETTSSLNDLGLTSKQEALYLELI